jgi:hypothetical protein
MKLFLVKLRGMRSVFSSPAYGCSYVVAEDSNSAYLLLKEYVDKNGLGFDHERELQSVELIAEDAEYPRCGTILFLTKHD